MCQPFVLAGSVQVHGPQPSGGAPRAHPAALSIGEKRMDSPGHLGRLTAVLPSAPGGAGSASPGARGLCRPAHPTSVNLDQGVPPGAGGSPAGSIVLETPG